MKPKASNRKVSLKFMDCAVTMEGCHRDIEKKALATMSRLVKDRMKVFEVLQELDHSDEDEGDPVKTKKKINPDVKKEFLKGYA